jgi:hypothetical protein
MMRRYSWMVAGVMLVSGAVLAVRSPGNPPAPEAQAAQADPPPLREHAKDALARIGELLDQEIDMRDFQLPMSLKEALGLLYEKLNADGKELPIIVDADAFKREDLDAPDIYETPVRFPPFPKKMTIGVALQRALKCVASGNATYIVKGGAIEITTFKSASIENLLTTRILANYQNRRLADILRDLSARTGVSILIDPRANVEANRTLSAKFHGDASLAGALRTLTDMADLKAIVLDGVVYITTPANAESLRKEKLQLLVGQDPLWPNVPAEPNLWMRAKEAGRRDQ